MTDTPQESEAVAKAMRRFWEKTAECRLNDMRFLNDELSKATALLRRFHEWHTRLEPDAVAYGAEPEDLYSASDIGKQTVAFLAGSPTTHVNEPAKTEHDREDVLTELARLGQEFDAAPDADYQRKVSHMQEDFPDGLGDA